MARDPIDSVDNRGGGGHLKVLQRVRQRLDAVETVAQVVGNVVHVYDIDDLPTPSGGFIDLVSGVTYLIHAMIDITPNTFRGIDFFMAGEVAGFNNVIVSATPNAMFVNDGPGFFNLQSLILINPIGSLFDVDFGTSVEDSLVFIEVIAFPGPFGSVGTIKDAQRLRLIGCFFFGFNDGITITGQVNEIIIHNCAMASVASAPNFAGIRVTSSATLDVALIDNMLFQTFNTGDKCISLDAGATYTKSFRVQSSTILGPGNFVDPAGLQKTAPEFLATGNIGLEDSLFTGSAGFTGNTVETVIVAMSTPVRIGSGAPSHVVFDGGSFTERFTLSGAETQLQKFTYNGLLPRTFTIRLDAVVTRTGGGSVLVAMGIQKNTVTVADSVLIFDVANLATSVFTLTTQSLTKDDTLELVIANNTGTANLTVISAKWTVFRVA